MKATTTLMLRLDDLGRMLRGETVTILPAQADREGYAVTLKGDDVAEVCMAVSQSLATHEALVKAGASHEEKQAAAINLAAAVVVLDRMGHLFTPPGGK